MNMRKSTISCITPVYSHLHRSTLVWEKSVTGFCWYYSCTSSPWKHCPQELHNNCNLYEVWATLCGCYTRGLLVPWRRIVIWSHRVFSIGCVLSLLNFTSIYWIWRWLLFHQVRMHYLAIWIKMKDNLWTHPVILICSKLWWVLPGPCYTPPPSFMKIGLFFHNFADRQTDKQIKNKTSLAEITTTSLT